MKRSALESATAFDPADFLANIFLYTAVAVENKSGKDTIDSVDKAFKERMMYQLIGFKDIPIHYLFIDEAQNISEKEGRSAFYYQVVGMLNRSKMRPHMIFASPHIPNPDIYLELIPNGIQGDRSEMTSLFTPVSQEKFLIDLQESKLGYYNGLTEELYVLHSFELDRDFQSFISELGKGKKNLIYCNAKAKVVKFAREYAGTLQPLDDPDLIALAEEIREQVHEDYYLAGTVEKGVAYHVGYLPTSIRLRIEELFRKCDGGIHTIFCTSTLLEGVKVSLSLLQCERASVRDEAKTVHNNMPRTV